MDDARTEEIGRNLARVRERIAAACRAAGREPDEVTLVAITKTYPAEDVAELAALGVHDVGENRDQEAAPKAAAVGDKDLRWHFVGQLQRNKCRSVVRYASAVHSVDSLRLVDALAAAAERAERTEPLGALVQVSLDDDEHRGGAVTGMVEQVAEAIAASPALRLRGVMAVAPLGWEPDEAFARLAAIAARIRQRFPGADWISAGMSNDLETAILYGSTHVRVGSALLGNRTPLG
ncbi:YggS family pyridoxal phosphate-dependent enzyme [Dactylosporangium roseum]|uniref:Pyridoxal phosphate homeostasis protein n=1 Tax=Dactylosporangium roseum TaxID=47989 RepID=A0ABY5Z0P3_9ACTN|nr:YggS family pyridoxal phosphate-dependent enzyme [Dactylosporangium roseum]UWZ35224.1 YggS family pyridoxal phosphate-dependent enzyme [Dactylosporangium roseum]